MQGNQPTEYIIISVAEYHCLTKAAALLEVVVNDPTYDNKALEAVKATVLQMQQLAGVGADQ